jgi:chromate transporter
MIHLNWLDWLLLFQNYLVMSLMSIGGAATTLPEMHRFLVSEHHWLTETQFNASVALAQSAPGPNLLIIALLAWNVGMNAGGSEVIGLTSVFVAMTGMLIPSSTLTLMVSGWLQRNRELRSVRAFKQGLAPLVVALLIATGWIMASAHSFGEWQPWAVTFITALLICRTRIHLLWPIGAGALLGWFGYI